jgi:manganese transport protein
MSIESDNGEFDAIATGERSDGGRLGARGTEEKEKGVPDVRVEGMDDDDSFSLRKFAAFVGPGFLMCIAYVDPGNFESNLQAGCQFGYSLLWVLMWATAMGLYIQALSIRLGLATGWHLARVMRDEYPTPARYSLWILTELAIIASDVPEVIGTALALKLIFGLPTVWGVLVTSASTLLFLALQQFGVRKLEAFMGSLVGVMSVCFVAQMAMLEGGDGGEVIQGIVVPIFQNGRALFIGISIIGAVVMPHNLFLHSALVLSRSFELGEKAVRRALKYNVAESALASGRHAGHQLCGDHRRGAVHQGRRI